MATKALNASTRRFTYGFAGAEFPDEKSAIDWAQHEYKEMKDKYGDEIKETYEQALVVEETSVYLQLTRVVEE